MTVSMEVYILSAVVKTGSEITETVLDTAKIIGNITYVWLVLFAYLSYMLLGIWYYSEVDETSLDMQIVINFIKRAKETSLVNVYVSSISLVIASIVDLINSRLDIIPFIITYIIFAFISNSFVSGQCIKLVSKEINQRQLSNKIEKKDSSVLNEETTSEQ